eukprot:14089658-Ditylum_brightwellii.AAC.1
MAVPNVPHGFQKWRFDTSKRTWYNANKRKRFFINSPSTPEDPVAQSKRFFKNVLSSSRNREQRVDQEVGNTNKKAKNKDVVCLKSTNSESQLTMKSSPRSTSYSPTSLSNGTIADK